MRLRLFAASLAAALAVALCAVPAFADDETNVIIEYPEVTVSPVKDYIHVNCYRGDGYITVLVSSDYGVNQYYPVWKTRIASSGAFSESDVSSSSPISVYEDSGIRYLQITLNDADNRAVTVTIRIVKFGDNNNEQGLFGVLTEGMSNSIDWAYAFIDSVTEQPVLVFFCFGLPILTIGITIIRRLLATRA